jgi:hypothetical protein
MRLFSENRLQVGVYICVAVVVFVLVLVLYAMDHQAFRKFLGEINPLIAFLLVGVGGVFLTAAAASQKWFVFYDQSSLKGLAYAAVGAAVFGIIMILADHRIIYAEDLNVLFPKSLMFYPAIAFLVEVVFHLLPLALLLFLMKWLHLGEPFEKRIWVAVVLVALLEPVFQLVFVGGSGTYSTGTLVFLSVFLFAFNMTQLTLLIQFDVVTALVFRLVYYAIWHVLWGHLRLARLF